MLNYIVYFIYLRGEQSMLFLTAVVYVFNGCFDFVTPMLRKRLLHTLM